MTTQPTDASNPLRQFFRRPVIYIKLPSSSKFWPQDSLEMPTSGELPVLAMTAIDEISYRTPDALFNGTAVVSVIESCLPNVSKAWDCPSTDVDLILVAIRIASYGHEYHQNCVCPECNEPATVGIDLRGVVDSFKPVDYSKQIVHGDLTFSFRPTSYKSMTDTNIETFGYQKAIQTAIATPEITEEQKMSVVTEAFAGLTTITINAVASSLASVKTPEMIVTEEKYIREFLVNTDRTLFERIKDHAVALREKSETPPIKVTCEKCKHEYTVPFILDMSNFFVAAS